MTATAGSNAPDVLSVLIGRWAVAAGPTRIRTLVGSCVGVVIYDRQARRGGVAHVVLPDSRGATEFPGKYADTAIPAMLADLRRLAPPMPAGRLTAKLVGGASMFQTAQAGAIGQSNREAVERVLAGLGIPVIARDLGGEAGRRLTLDTASGSVTVRIPTGEEYEI